jgi:hypothetical protein
MAMRPEEQTKHVTPSSRRNALYESPPVRLYAKSGALFVAPHVLLIDSKERRESNSLGGEAGQHNSSFDLAKSLADANEGHGLASGAAMRDRA